MGELSIIDASAPSAYVVASGETVLLGIAKPVLWRMLALQQIMALNLLHVLAHLAPLPDAAAAAQAIAQARQAALADEAGAALDATLRQHGAPARPVKEKPIRFVRKPKTAGTAA